MHQRENETERKGGPQKREVGRETDKAMDGTREMGLESESSPRVPRVSAAKGTKVPHEG